MGGGGRSAQLISFPMSHGDGIELSKIGVPQRPPPPPAEHHHRSFARAHEMDRYRNRQHRQAERLP